MSRKKHQYWPSNLSWGNQQFVTARTTRPCEHHHVEQLQVPALTVGVTEVATTSKEKGLGSFYGFLIPKDVVEENQIGTLFTTVGEEK